MNQKVDFHPGNSKRMQEAVRDFQMTMAHALRNDIVEQLKKRAQEEAGVLPPLEPHEMWDYLMDTDTEFLNWIFPYCPIAMTPSNLSHLHAAIISNFRRSIQPKVESENGVQIENE